MHVTQHDIWRLHSEWRYGRGWHQDLAHLLARRYESVRIVKQRKMQLSVTGPLDDIA